MNLKMNGLRRLAMTVVLSIPLLLACGMQSWAQGCTPSAVTVTDTICSNQLPYTWLGHIVTSGGTAVAKDTLLKAGGCDSVITLNLVVRNGSLVITNYTPANTSIALTAGSIIYAAAADAAGVKWFGQYTAGGVAKFDGATWARYQTTNGLASNTVYSIGTEAATGVKWFGTSAGVSRFDGTTWTTYNTTNGLANNNVRSVFVDAANNKWFGTVNGGVSRFNGTTWTTFTTANGLAGNIVYSIAADASGNIWFATNGGVSRFDGTTWTTYNTTNTAGGLLNNTVVAIAIDAAGNKWCGTSFGMSMFNGTTWTSYTTTNSGLPNNNIWDIEVDNQNNKWIATSGGGVAKFDGTTWTVYNTANGLVSNSVYSVAIDRSNNDKWIGTTAGISRISTLCISCGAPSNVTDNDTICVNQLPYTWLGHTITAGGNAIAKDTLSGFGGCDSIVTLNLVVTPNVIPSVTIRANDTTICSGTSVTFTATLVNGGTAPVYQWKRGTTVVGSNSPTFTTNALADGDVITCMVTVNNVCASMPTVTSPGLTMVVTPLPVITLNNSAIRICSGTPVQIIASGGTTYSWAPATGLSSTNDDTVVATVTANTTYTVTGTTNGCSSNATTTISVDTVVTSLVVTPHADTLCPGESAVITATTNNATTILAQSFNSTPAGWTVTYTGSANSQWQLRNSGFYTSNTTIVTPDGTPFFEADGTAGGNGTKSTTLTSPVFSLVGVTSAVFNCNNWYDYSSYDTYAGVEISTNGTTWTTIYTPPHAAWGGTQTLTPITPVSLNSYIGNANVQIRFRYNSGYGYAWAIDNVKITGTLQPVWTPAGGLYTNAALTTAYTGNPASIVYAKPGATTTYVAAIGACKTKDSSRITIGINPLSTESRTYCTAQLPATWRGITIPLTATSNAVYDTVHVANPAGCDSIITLNLAISSGVTSTESKSYCSNQLPATWNGIIIPASATTNPAYTTYTTINVHGCDSVVTLNLTVTPSVSPAVTVTVSPNDTICAGTLVTFTASPSNGGTTPAYQWKKGANIVGTNSPVYTDNALISGDVITVIMTSNAACTASSSATSTGINMTVNPVVTPAVSITVSPDDTICAGTTVIFTAIPVNGGTAPTYQWKRGTTVVGTNSPTYTSNALSNGDVITVTMAGNATCASTPGVASPGITMTVRPSVTPAVTVSVNPNDTICAGTPVTFTAIPVNGGATPVYQWRKGTAIVGTNSPAYTDNTLITGNVITVTMISNATCTTVNPATSTGVTMTVNNAVAPDITISATPGNAICAGSLVTFNAALSNGGTTPVYNWMKNGITVSTNSTYAANNLLNGDMIRCVLGSNATCTTTPYDTSNTIIMTVNSTATPTVTISASPGTNVSAGTLVTFTANITNGGTAPLYQWRKNGVIVSNNATYVTNVLANNDTITCTITSSNTCVMTNTAGSNKLVMRISTGIRPVTGTGGELTLYPNPNNGQFTVKGINLPDKEAVIEVINTIGQVVYRKTEAVNNGQLQTILNIPENNASGAYLLRVQTHSATDILRFMIAR